MIFSRILPRRGEIDIGGYKAFIMLTDIRIMCLWIQSIMREEGAARKSIS